MSALELRFWSKVDRRGPDECWPWKAAKRRRGYGVFWRAGKFVNASRVAWELANGRPMPAEMRPLHGCDNPPCCNPRHIRPGTQKENVAEMHARGRTNLPRGEKHWTHGLSLSDIRARRQRKQLAGEAGEAAVAPLIGGAL